MIVVSMTQCPPKLRGDLSKWLLEINTGVYVGHVNARVRDALWKRICENISDGQATMVFNTNNEQHMDFYVHNTSWKPVDFDGIKLMQHPDKFVRPSEGELKVGFSDAAKMRMANKRRRKRTAEGLVILDIETTGLSCVEDEIIEIGAIEIRDDKIVREFSELIRIEKEVPESIQKLTGIDKHMLEENGKELSLVLWDLFEILEGKNVAIYNADFDLGFLKKAAEQCDIDFPDIATKDVFYEVKNKLADLENFRLETVAGFLGVDIEQTHRALADCKLLHEVCLKLNKI